jgi:Spondin_N
LLIKNAITDVFLGDLKAAGELVGYVAEGKGFLVDTKKLDDNYVYLPPLQVTEEHSFISGIAPISPSPDWYSGFYLFDTKKEDTQTFWEAFKIRTYPWDAGSDSGDTYTAQDRDTDPPEFVTRIEVGNTVNEIFLSPAGDQVRYLAEWECVLNLCPLDNPECEKPDWPPANNCDVLKYPQCNMPCDPEVEQGCEQCKRESNNEKKVYHKNCCLAGREPKDGSCEAEGDGVANASGAMKYQHFGITVAIVALVISCLL